MHIANCHKNVQKYKQFAIDLRTLYVGLNRNQVVKLENKRIDRMIQKERFNITQMRRQEIILKTL